MYYSELKEGVKHFKAKEGKEEMCESIENYANKKVQRVKEEAELKAKQAKENGIAEGELKTYINLIKDNILTIEEVAERLNMSVDQLKEYMKA
jgi:transcriptional regulator GlxA family with amidase domain